MKKKTKKKSKKQSKKRSKKQILILVLLVVLLLAINYNYINDALKEIFKEYDTGVVQRVIDGDTIIINGESIRLLGINAPEKGEMYYEEAKDYLDNRIVNKEVELRYGKDRYDKYNRVLAYIFLRDKNINKELIDQGYANHYFPFDRDEYYLEFKEAWNSCLLKNVNLCEKSEANCSECVEVVLNDALKNICSFSCDLRGWEIKAEGRKTINFSSIVESKEVFTFDLDYGEIGDTLFLRDSEGRLVLWKELEF